MNKSEVCERIGWTKGRVDRFLIIEHVHIRRGTYGHYAEYEYSFPQILEVENSSEWRVAAAKYLKITLGDLDSTIASLHIEREGKRIAQQAASAEIAARWKAGIAEAAARREAESASVRGGLCRIGCSQPLSDGWRTFEASEVLVYIDFADRRGRIDGNYVREFYRLWSAGAGYCNPRGVLRRLIAPVKNRLIRILLHLSRKHEWGHGIAPDSKGQRVLYIDTPFGQASFHLMRHEGTDLPPYGGTWSGIRNSDEILAQLFDSFHHARLDQQEAA